MVNKQPTPDGTIDNVEQGDIITFTIPEAFAYDDYDGEEITGGVATVWKAEDDENHYDTTTLNVKSGAYFQITADNFISIDEKQAF